MDLTNERRANLESNINNQMSKARCNGCAATLTLEEWLGVLNRYEWKCAYCRTKPYQGIEHLIPIQAGGGTTANNCVPSCRECNQKKGMREAYLDEQGTAIIIPGTAKSKAKRQAEKTIKQYANTDIFLTPKQVADRLHVSVPTVIRLFKKHELPAEKVGHQWRLRETYLNEDRSA